MPRRLAILVPLLLAAMLALPSSSLAHAYLVRSEPEAGERLQSAPRELKLFFSEPFVPGSERVSVRFSGGEKLRLGAPVRRDTVVSQALPPVSDEIMIVNWRVVAEDGHISAGELAFAAGQTASLPTVASRSTAGARGGDVLLSWVFFVGLALALGGLVSERLIWRRESIDAAVARAPVLAGVATALVATVLLLVTLDTNLSSRPAKLLGAQAFLLVVALALLPVARRLAILPLLATTVATAARGHSGTSTDHWWAVPADALHLAAAAIWVGALAHLVLLARRIGLDGFRPLLAGGAGRYARLALVTVAVSIVGGLGTALAQFASLSELIDTGYGRALLVKSALIGVALATAGAARTLALPGGGFVERVRSRELAAVAVSLLVFALLFGPQPGHLAAAALFTGSLLYLALLALRGGTWSGSRYAGVAVAGLLALFASGAMAAIAGARTPEPSDDEAWVAITQIGLAAAGIALLLVLVLRTRPSPDGSVPLLRRLTGAETLVLAAALGAAAVLVNVAPPGGQAAAFETLGPPPLRGPAIRMGSYVGQLAVGIAATERELRFEIFAGSFAVRGAEIAVTASQPGTLSADLFPRPCGDGCFTIRFRLPRGTTTIEARVTAPARAGGTARFDIPWPPRREQSQLLARVAKTMAAQPRLRVTELVTSGPGTNARPLGVVLSGRRLLESEAYGRGGVDVRVVGRTADLTELVFALPPSKLWYRMWIDDRYRVRRQVLVNRGHRITRTFEYDAP